jgi:hypothetical protein
MTVCTTGTHEHCPTRLLILCGEEYIERWFEVSLGRIDHLRGIVSVTIGIPFLPKVYLKVSLCMEHKGYKEQQGQERLSTPIKRDFFHVFIL